MKIKRIAVFLLLLFVPFLVLAEHVSFAEARTTAQNWTKILKHTFNNSVTVLSGEKITREGILVAYVFHFSPRGYVIVSTEDYLPPIKLYSLKNDFGKEGRELEDLVFCQYRDIITKVKSTEINPDTFFSNRNSRNFKLLKQGFKAPGPALPPRIAFSSGAAEVAPLLTTTWNQLEPFNLRCPKIDGQLPPSGCVATAFAQVMKYYAYPERGRGSWYYTSRTEELSVTTSFDHAYSWEQMLNDYPQADSGTMEQRDAVAELLFDAGVALQMDYTLEGSGAYPSWAVFSYPKFFNYSRELLYVRRTGWNDAEWFSLAKNQVERGIPVLLGISREGGAHLVVIDGYRLSAGADTFHLNMGWGGAWDGYYSLNNIVTGSREYTITEFQNYVINLVPPDAGIEAADLNIGSDAYENRSLFFKEYVCELTWKGPPAAQGIVDKYEIITYDTVYGDYELVTEVNNTSPDGINRYRFRLADYTAYVYIVQAVFSDGTKLAVMFCNPILRD